MQGQISLDDVLASATAFEGKVLEYDANNANDLRTKNPKSAYDVSYIPLKFKHVSGKKISPVDIVFKEQIVSSSANQPPSSDGIPSCLNLVFKKLKKEDLECGDYIPRSMDTAELQTKENERMSKNIDKYLSNNDKLIKVLDILFSSYMHLCENINANQNDFKFRICKEKGVKTMKICVIKQVTRLDRITNKDVELETPLYRLKLPVVKDSGLVGIFRSGTMKYNVFDARKMTAKNKYKPVAAKVKVNGKMKDLDYQNAREFITYNSLLGGIIRFDAISSSKAGLSLQNSLYELYVFRHKTKFTRQIMTKDDIIEMRGGNVDEDEDDDEAEINDDGESEFVGKNPDGDDDEEEEEEEEEEPNDSDDDEKSKKKIPNVKTIKRVTNK